jgi:hypothetical protein
LNTQLCFTDDDKMDLTLRNSGDEAEEDMNELEEKRRQERAEREKWIQGEK